ncbi:hypothetical protein Agub_g8146, partial [Astrephomene gubernaculifera]
LPHQLLDLLHVPSLEADSGELLDDSAKAQLMAFSSCFAKAEIGTLHLGRHSTATSAAAVQQVVEILGDPKQLRAEPLLSSNPLYGKRQRLRIDIQVAAAPPAGPCQQQQAAASAADEQQQWQEEELEPPLLPSAWQLTNAAADWLAAAGTRWHGGAAAAAAIPAAAAENRDEETTTVEGLPGRCVLLRGDFVAALTHGSPGLLSDWLYELEERATDVTGIDCMQSYQVLQTAGAVVVAYYRGTEEAAMNAALVDVATRQGPTSLEVVLLGPLPETSYDSLCPLPLQYVQIAVQKVAQEAWDAAAPKTGKRGVQVGGQRLEWLCGLRLQMQYVVGSVELV